MWWGFCHRWSAILVKDSSLPQSMYSAHPIADSKVVRELTVSHAAAAVNSQPRVALRAPLVVRWCGVSDGMQPAHTAGTRKAYLSRILRTY